ncbi:MAG: outer membrane protein assembly factor BamA [Verrucomicrobia bacterium]|nr:outer membrane protein assembly factor BamA [Verrucomicrobiota bacterium]MDA1087956.1 outer membrane protein assembly factor BamA [Verrucomicrobiota bacterium]
MKRSPRLAGLLGMLLLAPIIAAAEPVVNRIVVRSDGPGPRLEAFILNHISTRQGDELDRLRVRRDVRALLDTGRFSSVNAVTDQQDDGITLIIAVENRMRLSGTLQVEGAKVLSASRIRALLDLVEDDYIDEQVMAVRSRAVYDEYVRKRYPNTQLTWDIAVTDELNGRATVTVHLDEGGSARLKGYTFYGNTLISDRALKNLVKDWKVYNPFSWFRRVGTDEGVLAEMREKIRTLYLSMGALDVAVSSERVSMDEHGHGALVVQIDEGPVYRVGETSVRGNTVFVDGELDSAHGLPGGVLAAMDRIQAAASRIRDYYGSRGYINAGVVPHLEAREAEGLVDVTFTVREGELIRIRNIFVRGNDRTKDKVIRRELLVYPGERYDEVKVTRSERRLMNLGYFAKVDSYPEGARAGSDERDIAFQVEEQRTGSVLFGAGFSSIDQLVGFMELSQGNFDIGGWPFTGGGQKLNLRAQFGSKRRDYSLSFTEPWFLDRKLSFGVDLFNRDREFEGFEVRRQGGALRLGKPLAGRWRADLTYRIESEDITDTTDTDVWFTDTGSEFFFTTEEEATESALGLRLTHDTRNRVFIPTQGHRYTVSGSLSGGPLGFDTELYNLEYRSDHFFQVWREHVFGMHFRAEVVEEYGSTSELFLFDKLYIGGGRTVRGYEFRDVGPKVVRFGESGEVIDHRPIGGRSLGLASAEYVFPLTSGLRMAGFVDAGNVWADAYEFDVGNIASSAGLEIRLDIPQFPVRFYYAWSLQKDDELTDEEPFGFWIGF